MFSRSHVSKFYCKIKMNRVFLFEKQGKIEYLHNVNYHHVFLILVG